MSKRYTFTRPYDDAYEIVDRGIDKAMKPEDVADLLNQQTQRISELEEQLKNLKEKYISMINENVIAFDKLEKELANAIVPKFKINQIVYIVDKYFDKIYELKITSIRASRFKDKHFNSISYDGHLEESLLATKEEAESKLKELKGE